MGDRVDQAQVHVVENVDQGVFADGATGEEHFVSQNYGVLKNTQTALSRPSPTSPQATSSSCTPKWLVGCDGAHSDVRTLLELPFSGKDYPDRFVQADGRYPIPGTAVVADCRANLSGC